MPLDTPENIKTNTEHITTYVLDDSKNIIL
jgi:hypothetical protein